MKAILLPAILLVAGSGAGVGAGLFLSGTYAAAAGDMPGADMPATGDAGAMSGGPCGDLPGAEPAAAEAEAPAAPGGEVVDGREYVRLNNQFVVPVVDGGAVTALVVLSLSVEVSAGAREPVYAHEPKLRDAFLQVLFDHANIGGFGGNFTSSSTMRVLRGNLREAAQATMGKQIVDVLIIDIVRQDIQG